MWSVCVFTECVKYVVVDGDEKAVRGERRLSLVSALVVACGGWRTRCTESEISGAAPRDHGRSRAKAVSRSSTDHSTPPPPHPTPTHRRAALSRAISERRSRGVTLAQKTEGPGWSHGAHALARGAASQTLRHFGGVGEGKRKTTLVQVLQVCMCVCVCVCTTHSHVLQKCSRKENNRKRV